MNILVVGSEGFIGKHCVRHFSRKGDVVFGCDLLNAPSEDYHYIKVSRLQPTYEALLAGNSFDLIICAGGSGSVPLSFHSPWMDFEANVADIYMLLQTVKEKQPHCKVINLSSAAVYGNPKVLPVSESAEIVPLSPYGWNKYLSELVCVEYYSLFSIQSCSVRPFSVYGPGLKKQIVWDLYQKMLSNPDQLEVFGTGQETRDFIYIDDFISAIDVVAEKADFKGETYNVASGVQIPIHVLCELLTAKATYKGKIAYNNIERPGDPKFWQADLEKIMALGYTPKMDISTGLTLTLEWLQTSV